MDSTATPATRVVTAVAGAADTDPIDLPPLYDTIDPEALNTLIKSAENGSVLLTFSYTGYTVIVHGDGEIDVEETPGHEAATGSRPNLLKIDRLVGDRISVVEE